MNLILATGGTGMVRAAYASGKPAYGVGPGNVPVYVDRSCRDLDGAVLGMLRSKLMDYGTSCSAEQALVVDKEIEPAYREALERHGTRFLGDDEHVRLKHVCVDEEGRVRPDAIGQSAAALASLADIPVERDVELLAVELDRVARDEPFSTEILTSAIAYYVAADAEEGIDLCDRLLALGGRGHTAIVWGEDRGVIERFAKLPVGRVLTNLPGTWGTAGLLSRMEPSFMLGTGVWSGSITSQNITFRHMTQSKRLVGPVRTAEEFLAEMERGPSVPAPAMGLSGQRDVESSRDDSSGDDVSLTAGIVTGGGSYLSAPLAPDEEELVEATVSEVLRELNKGAP